MAYSQKYIDYMKSERWEQKRESRLGLNMAENCGIIRCDICGTSTYPVTSHGMGWQCHHLTYKNLGNEPLSDLQILCIHCHQHAHQK